jgi:hypothetical protein
MVCWACPDIVQGTRVDIDLGTSRRRLVALGGLREKGRRASTWFARNGAFRIGRRVFHVDGPRASSSQAHQDDSGLLMRGTVMTVNTLLRNGGSSFKQCLCNATLLQTRNDGDVSWIHPLPDGGKSHASFPAPVVSKIQNRVDYETSCNSCSITGV